MTGVDLENPDLAQKVRSMGAEDLRRLALSAAEYALARYPIEDVRVTNARGHLRGGKTGPSLARDELMAVVDEYDAIGFDLGDTLDAYGQGAKRQEYLDAYCRARAAHALWYALDDDPVTAALDALYEASATTEGWGELSALVEKLSN